MTKTLRKKIITKNVKNASRKTENIEGLMEMNVRMVRESEEQQQKFLENLFKQKQEVEKLEREKDWEFLLKLGQMFKNDN